MGTRRLRIGLVAVALAGTACGGGSGGGSGNASGSTVADADAVAEALDCADSFQATDAPPMMGPEPDSAGFCQAEGGVSFEVYASGDDVEEIVDDFPDVGCSVMKGFGIERFTTVVGGNWMVTVNGDTDGAASERVATTLDGEVHEFDCS